MNSVIDLSQLPAPNLLEPVDYQTTLADLQRYFNEQQPMLFADTHHPQIKEAELVETPAGDRYWRVPVGEEAGLYYIEHPADPNAKQLGQFAYREMLFLQRANDAARSLLVAYSQGADLENLVADLNVQRLENEDDARLRRRRQLAVEAFTTAGSKGAYEYYALTAHIGVQDVYITRPTFRRVPDGSRIVLEVLNDARLDNAMPGDVAVTVLVAGGYDRAEVKQAVEAALDTDNTIPYTDNPRILDPEIIDYQVHAELVCYPGPSTGPVIDAARAALEEYVQAHYLLGHDIAESGLHAAAHQPGVQTVNLNITADIPVQPWQAARCTAIDVALGGRNV